MEQVVSKVVTVSQVPAKAPAFHELVGFGLGSNAVHMRTRGVYPPGKYPLCNCAELRGTGPAHKDKPIYFCLRCHKHLMREYAERKYPLGDIQVRLPAIPVAARLMADGGYPESGVLHGCSDHYLGIIGAYYDWGRGRSYSLAYGVVNDDLEVVSVIESTSKHGDQIYNLDRLPPADSRRSVPKHLFIDHESIVFLGFIDLNKALKATRHA